MYQYQARTKTDKEVVAEGHTIEKIETLIIGFRRGEKKGEHTKGNVPIEIIHVKRDQKTGLKKEVVLKVV